MSDYKFIYQGSTGEWHTRPGKGLTDLKNFFKFSRNLKKIKLNSRYAYVLQNDIAEKIEENEKINKFFTKKNLRDILLDYKRNKEISEDQFNNLLIIASGGELEEESKEEKNIKTEKVDEFGMSKEENQEREDLEQYSRNLEADRQSEDENAQRAAASARAAREARNEEIYKMGKDI